MQEGQAFPEGEKFLAECKDESTQLCKTLTRARIVYGFEIDISINVAARDEEIRGFLNDFDDRMPCLKQWEVLSFLFDMFT